MTQSEIKLVIKLDENKMPEQIHWTATDSGQEGTREAKAFSLSIWDKNESATLGIDLWTKEMLIEEMNKHYYQIFMKMADTYVRSTNNSPVSEMIKEFADTFWKSSSPEKVE